ncbi:hypothetical protein D3C83_257240 [compost metagenome]
MLVLVRKAIMIYEKTLVVGLSATTAEAWIVGIEKALERLRSIYLADPSAVRAPI